MDWKTLAADLTKVGAPLIGTALGGPIGGIVGNLAGKLVADALGVENTPDAVNAAIAPAIAPNADPAIAQEIADKLKTADENFATSMAKVNQTELEQIGLSERAELVNGNWFQSSWRPLNGYVTTMLIAVFGLEIAASMGQAIWTGKPDILNAVFAGITSIVFFLSIPAGIAGVTSIGRSFEKVSGMSIGKYGSYVAGAVKSVVVGKK